MRKVAVKILKRKSEKKVARYSISAIMLMISGDSMKKHIVVKQKHLYTEERNLMFEGQAFFSDSNGCLRLSYTERGSNTAVSVEAENEGLRIQRDGELMTRLTFQHKKQTTGSVLSEFGTIDIGVFTHKYIKREYIIAIEYDILSGDEVTDGYRILWILKEDKV